MTGRVSSSHRDYLVLALCVCALSAVAWLNRFIQDDAFISFQYASNLANGKGLIWNGAEGGGRIEGYTNFLWTLMLTVPLYAHANPVAYVYVIGIALYALTLFLTYHVGLLLSRSKTISLLAVALLGTNYSFLAYATGGLETQLQACLFTASILLLLRQFQANAWSIRAALGLSLLSSAAILTRLDSALVEGVILAVAALNIWMRTSSRKRIGLFLALTLPLSLIIGSWLAWKLAYYGNLLPNTFYAKVSWSATARVGLHYLALFMSSYLLFPFLAVIPAAWISKRRESWPSIPILLALVIVWCLYVAWVGGDFMEFRFMVPILPMFFLVVVWSIGAISPRSSVRLAAVALILAGSLHHTLAFEDSAWRQQLRIETVGELAGHLTDPDENWIEVGKILGGSFRGRAPVLIATTAAGAIPFYSQLPTVDMLGLSDAWIANQGVIVGSKVGHQRRPTLAYLLERKVNLVVGHPWLEATTDTGRQPYSLQDKERLAIRFSLVVEDWSLLPRDAAIIEIPVEEYTLAILYLVPSVSVDRAIVENRWKIYPVGNRARFGDIDSHQ